MAIFYNRIHGTETSIHHLLVVANRSQLASDRTPELPHQVVEVQGYQGFMIDCPAWAGLYAYHVLLTWSAGGIAHAVSAHGHTEVNRRVILAIAESVRLVQPWGKALSPQ